MKPYELIPEELEMLQKYQEPSNESMGYERNIANVANKKMLMYLHNNNLFIHNGRSEKKCTICQIFKEFGIEK